ncbi:uncharacterized protein C8R40DRAFT_1173144 [Lentinula edodes]|uniref:uncharacterized protein n=1 Tax=Lentinula edodes TaxID=5353 RepID=UPI001E8CE288|nr:uncharacterized protein C8R40DRAFT_1173144 [Lentinula edodes]KAH7872740.1 hypothetical protein C8R40DRAFT_1173144 [Lentinula edodes]
MVARNSPDASPTLSILLSNKHVELPTDILREIFETTARNFPGTGVKLAGLCKRTQYWMEWFIYETVVLDHPSTRTSAFLRTIDARPAEFFSQRVKNLYLSYTITLDEAQKILPVCSSLTHLTCWAQSSQRPGWLMPLLSSSTLTRLSIKLDMLTTRGALLSFSDKIFQALTHLEIVSPPSVKTGMSVDWTTLIGLPKLKHLIIGNLFSWDHFYLLPIIRGLLDLSVSLEVLAILSKDERMLEALGCQEFIDPRLVILPRFNWPLDLPTYWKNLYTGELDAWEPSVQEAMKQRLERNQQIRLTTPLYQD